MQFLKGKLYHKGKFEVGTQGVCKAYMVTLGLYKGYIGPTWGQLRA